MRAHVCLTLTLVFAVGTNVVRVNAQTSARASVSINAGSQPSSISFAGSATNIVNLENAVTNTGYKVANGPAFDGGVAVRLLGHLGIGVGISSFSNEHDASISASIPHPFFFNTPRSISGVGSLRRNELAAHVQAVYVLATGRKWDIAIAGGPSFFSTEQDVVSDVTYAETYPYDTATFVAASTSRVSKKAVGFNASADVTVHVAPHVGLGVLVRFSRASLEFAVPSHAETVKLNAGGVQVGGGLRLFF